MALLHVEEEEIMHLHLHQFIMVDLLVTPEVGHALVSIVVNHTDVLESTVVNRTDALESTVVSRTGALVNGAVTDDMMAMRTGVAQDGVMDHTMTIGAGIIGVDLIMMDGIQPLLSSSPDHHITIPHLMVP